MDQLEHFVGEGEPGFEGRGTARGRGAEGASRG
jgi:hypothetical protein